MTRIHVWTAAIGAAASLAAGAAAAQDPGGLRARQPTTAEHGVSGPLTAAPHDAADFEFLQDAVRTDLAEARFGELAEQRAQVPAVREYGAKVRADHTRAIEDKAPLLETAGQEVPTEPSLESLQLHEALAALPDEEFDAAFIEHMIAAHEAALEAYGAQTHANPNEALADIARTGLATVREHLAIAQSLRDGDASAQSRADPRLQRGPAAQRSQ